MLISLVLLERELSDDEIEALLIECGHHVQDIVGASVPASEVVALASRSDPGVEIVRVAVDRGWTVLADESMRLPEARAVWQRLAETRGIRSLALLADDEMVGFAAHDPQRGSRVVAAAGANVHSSGEPLPIEVVLHPSPSRGDLVLLAQSMGVDLDRLNREVIYRVLACRR